MNQDIGFDEKLKQEWNNRYNENDKLLIFKSTIKFIHQRVIVNSPFLAYFNRQLIENKREPQIQIEQDQIALVQDFDEETFNFSQVPEQQILFYVDLENEEIYDKQKHEQPFEHLIIINEAPICSRHSMVIPFIKEQLPQVLGGDIFQLVLNIFAMTESQTLRLGFNSIAGQASINHLHFHVVYVEEFFPDIKMFPVERFPKQLLLENNLQSQDQIQMYNVGLKISKVEGYPVETMVLQSLKTPKTKEDLAEIYTSLSFGLQIIIEILLENKMAHNVLVSDSGLTIYIYLRKQQCLLQNLHAMKPAWIELSGVAVCRNKQIYDDITAEQFDEILRKEVSVSQEEFTAIFEKVASKINGKFK